jgi:hypothetical protein
MSWYLLFYQAQVQQGHLANAIADHQQAFKA